MNYFTLPNILILFAVVFILFLLTEVKNYKSKNKEDEKEDLEEKFSNTLPDSKKIEIKEIKYEEVDKEQEKRKAQEELMNLRLKMMEEKAFQEKENIITKEETSTNKDISPNIIPLREEDLKKEEVIEKKYKTIEEKDEERLEQEEMDAIISINELETKGQKMYDSLEKEQLDEEEIPISIEELYETMELPTVNVKKFEKKALYDLTETKEYPLVEIEKEDVITKEQEKNKEILDEELKKTDEFLSFLKELKKNLE